MYTRRPVIFGAGSGVVVLGSPIALRSGWRLVAPSAWSSAPAAAAAAARAAARAAVGAATAAVAAGRPSKPSRGFHV